jgi:pimeloyl-ACP methyl ester carboxylesterase
LSTADCSAQLWVGDITYIRTWEGAREISDAIAVLDHLGWDRAIAVGHSWGVTFSFT